jgi:hypothetical protein
MKVSVRRVSIDLYWSQTQAPRRLNPYPDFCAGLAHVSAHIVAYNGIGNPYPDFCAGLAHLSDWEEVSGREKTEGRPKLV